VTDLQATVVDPSNTDQARAWDGDEGEFWATHAERFELSLARYNPRLLDAAGIQDHAQVLDVGCGTGDTTRAAGRLASSGAALGVDLSRRMIQVARQLAAREGLTNARFEQVDAQIHPFAESSIDVVISRTGAMFFGDLVAAFRNLGRALRPEGRMALLVWQEPPRNEWILDISTALAAGRSRPPPPPEAPGPFAMSDPDRVRSVLHRAGFAAPRFENLHEPMYFGSDPDDAHKFILGLAGWMMDGLDDDGRARALDALRTTLDAHDTDEGVMYDSAAWLITAERP
jgi:SAM-dependent methyltransferase